MKSNHFILICTLSLIACSQSSIKNEVAEETTVEFRDEELSSKEVNKDSIVLTINTLRKTIENNLPEPFTLNHESFRAKTKQKWNKIHFYIIDNEVVRIKTYPYKSVSNRTEEFYLNEGKLILAVIEDNGNGERGKSQENIDKMYYFHQEELIKEVKAAAKEEYSIKESDAEELLEEVKEYLALLKKNQ